MNQATGITVRTIARVSPSLAEILRVCKLRAGLSVAPEARRYVLGNPKAWLGSAYHAVLERVAPGDPLDVDARSRKLWNESVDRAFRRAQSHPLDSRFGPPRTWPSYYLTEAMALMRAKELAVHVRRNRSEVRGKRPKPSREGTSDSEQGKLVGRPDLVRSDEIVDFKTGSVFDVDDPDEVKPAYIRQLKLYAFLIREARGKWPRRGILMPMSGPSVVVDLSPAACESEAQTAVRLLEEFNRAVLTISDPVHLASPSPAACRWCPYQLFCPAFWEAVEPGWEDDLRTGCSAGTVSMSAELHTGEALTISFVADHGTVKSGTLVSLAPLEAAAHREVPKAPLGKHLRATGLWQRSDGSVVATKRTLIALGDSQPTILIN